MTKYKLKYSNKLSVFYYLNMKMRIYALFLTVFIFFLTSCINEKVENAPVDLSKTEINQNDKITVENNTNNQKEKININSNSETNEEVVFEGTAGITDKPNKITRAAVLRQVRIAPHTDFDRMVFEFDGNELPGYHVEYIDKPVRQCGSGNVVELKGDGWLEIRFMPAQAHDENGQLTVENRWLTPNYKIFKEIKLTCDFEADVTWVIGAASPNEYRVIELKNPARMAVDIKHQNTRNTNF